MLKTAGTPTTEGTLQQVETPRTKGISTTVVPHQQKKRQQQN
jgi:hypothetical protein